MTLRKLALSAVAVMGLTAACAADMDPVNSSVSFSFNGLEPLGGGLLYEGWAMIDGTPETTGLFNLDANGNLIDEEGNTIAGGTFETSLDLSAATAFVISIEPANDTDPAPADTKVLGGANDAGSASLTVAHEAALGDDFTGAEGEYLIATPTTLADTTDETAGVWFMDPTDMGRLTLPTLPAGWAYEGWAVVDGTPWSTGTFTDADASDDSALYSGQDASPQVPGEDFVANAPAGSTFPLDLSGGMIVISVEPSPDDSTAPFTLKPLNATVASPANVGTATALTNQAAGLATGTATVQ